MFSSHWCRLIEDLQVSPTDFYKSVEAALDRRQIPGLHRERVQWPEGGLLSAKRVYLRLSREKLQFDICAAPFGTGFFVSSRMVETEFPWFLILTFIGLIMVLGCLMLIVVAIVTRGVLGIAAAGVFIPMLLFALVCLGFTWWYGEKVLRELDKCFMNSPVLGSWYERITRRNTYYRIDLVIMFKEAVHAAVMEAVDQYCGDHHLQPLSEFERKPTVPHLMMR